MIHNYKKYNEKMHRPHTLLTFCPPAPELLSKDISILSSGIVSLFGTTQLSSLLLLEKFLLGPLLFLLAPFLFFGGGLYGVYVHVGSTVGSSSFVSALSPLLPLNFVNGMSTNALLLLLLVL